MDFSGIDQPETWVALLSLAAMEIVLGIDNIVFITILTGQLPPEQRMRTARIGIFLALFMRIALLFAIAWIMTLTTELWRPFGISITGKSLILIVGGLFLVGKSVTEIHKKIDGHDETPVGTSGKAKRAVGMVLAQILALDLIFSLDSVITAVGMVEPDEIWVMVVAIVAAVIMMLVGARPIGDFVSRHPTIKVLALAFLIRSAGCSSPRGSVGTSRRATSTSRSRSPSGSRRSTCACDAPRSPRRSRPLRSRRRRPRSSAAAQRPIWIGFTSTIGASAGRIVSMSIAGLYPALMPAPGYDPRGRPRSS
jgi:predicted tellurium resistance membrane protein TerC